MEGNKLKEIIQSDFIQKSKTDFKGDKVDEEKLLNNLNWLIERAKQADKFEALFHRYVDRYTELVGKKNEIIELANNYKSGRIDVTKKSFFADEVINILTK